MTVFNHQILEGNAMQDNRKFNKRPKSITEFRSSYSDNKNNFSSTDAAFRRQAVVKYVLIGILLAVVVVAGFLITDALLNVSEEPYVPPKETTTEVSRKEIDKKYFQNQVTVPAEEVDETETTADERE